LYIHNQNPSNQHTYTLNAFQTGNQAVTDYTNNTDHWNTLAVVGTPSPVAALTTNSLYLHANAAAYVALQFAGAATAAGSPDNADIWLVQTTAQSCGAVNPFTGQQYNLSTPNTGTSASVPIMTVSDGIGQSFYSTSSFTNPAGNAMLLYVNANGGARALYYDKIFLSSTATETISLISISGNGSTCSSAGIGNIKSNGTGTTANSTFSCGTPPVGGNTVAVFNLSANTPFVLDLKGFISAAGSTAGLEILQGSSALVGTVSMTFFWYEK
jgi:hypothetical protein